MSLFLDKRWGEVLGMNARTLEYVKKANTDAATRLANRKLATKRVLQKAAVPTPRLFGVIASRSELKRFRWTKLPASFVLKPNSASGGGGIVVIFGRNKKGNWVKADKTEVFIPELKSHVLEILDGRFSKGNVPDKAFFEQRVKIHADLKPYSIKGVPDIRVLIYNLVPVMAMLRLPTEESGGRANLHSGGIGVGIDLSRGITTVAVQHGRVIESLPDKRLPLSGLQLPEWNEVLNVAVRAAQASNLNFAGVDVTIDREDGPMILETNARPGLDIQYANLAPLRSRLRRVEGLTIPSVEKAVQIGKSLFGLTGADEVADLTDRTILNVEEEVIVLDHDGQPHPMKAKVDTGAYRTTIDKNLAKTLAIHQPVIEFREVYGALGQQRRPVVEITLKIRGHELTTMAFLADRSRMKYDMILGRRDLKGFLINPTRSPKKT